MAEELKLIVAYDNHGLIGSQGELPWHLPADLKHFKELTTGNTVIMGRKTYQSIKNRLGGSLPNRLNVVLTRQLGLEIEGCEVVNSLDDAMEIASKNGDVFVIGGAQIYHLAMPVADKLLVTQIDAEFDGDVYFPAVAEDEWLETSREDHVANEENPFNYSFVEYERIR